MVATIYYRIYTSLGYPELLRRKSTGLWTVILLTVWIHVSHLHVFMGLQRRVRGETGFIYHYKLDHGNFQGGEPTADF